VNSRQPTPEELGLPTAAQARVALAYAQPALDEALACGVSPADLGLPTPPPDPLPALRYMALLEDAAARSGVADFGLRVGARQRTASFVAYGAVVLACPTFGDAVLQTRRFESLAHDLGRSELRVEDGEAEYLWHCPWLALQPGRQVCESVMAGIHAFASWLAQRPLPVHALAFPHPAPEAAVRERIDAHFGLRVRYDAPETSARFDATFLLDPIPSADPALFPLLEQHAAALLAARQRALAAGDAPRGLAGEVRRLITERLAHDGARLSDLAAALGLSARTLQRRLAEEGSPFQTLLDSTRRELAAQYLRDASLSLTEIAFLLGYAEQSSFTHAYRGWHGRAPGQGRGVGQA
jgi:AraC-like DNA-binding protein